VCGSSSRISGEGDCAGSLERQARIVRQQRRFLWRVQKMAFWVLYDYAGYLIALNVLSLAVVFGPPWLLYELTGGYAPVATLLAALLGVLAVAGQATLIVALLDGEDFSFRRVIFGVVAHGPRALGLAALFALALFIAILAARFYANRVLPVRPSVGLLLSGLCLSGGAALLLSGVYVLPALVNQRGTALRALRTSLVLAGRHPVLTPGLLVLMLAQGLLLATPPGVMLLSTMPLVALVCCAYELLARHHAASEGGAPGDTGPTPDEEDIFLNRGFKDILFPWKG
jgi:hypothetical protein